jgi:mediator of RNA polymerase II transcription subunit 31
VEELEFLQCLANPDYVQWLAAQGYLEDSAFLDFLKYLRYWRKPPHIYHVVYPQGLRMLEMLLDPSVRCRMHLLDARALLMTQMMGKWAASTEVSAELDAAVTLLVDRRRNEVTVERSQQQQKTGPEVLRDQDVLQDWTGLSDVLADKAWHERLAAIDTSAHTVEHGARLTGRQFMEKSHKAEQLERAMVKFNHLWTDERPRSACDLEQILVAPRAQGETLPEGLLPNDALPIQKAIFAHLPVPLAPRPVAPRPVAPRPVAPGPEAQPQGFRRSKRRRGQ